MRRLLAALLVAATPLVAQPGTKTPLELDHVLILVPPGGKAGIDALRRAGLNVANEVTKHTGQGTASTGVLFDNAYLELIWIDSTVRRDPGNALDVARWRRPGVAKVGIGLRRAGIVAPASTAPNAARPPASAPPDLGVPARRYSAPWMPPGTAIQLLRQPAESLAAELFVVQDEIALPWWIANVRREAPILLQHPGRWQRVRRVVVHGPAAQAPAAFARLAPARVALRTDAASWVEVELEGGPAGTVDLRPALPLVLRR